MEQEIWKDVVGYEGYYQVSNLGRVQCLKKSVRGKVSERSTPKVMTPAFNNVTGYYAVGFGEWGIFKHMPFSVHRLVALHFIDNPDNLPEVNHEDGDKSNNTATNLKWASREQNIQHGFKHGLIKTPRGVDAVHAKLSEATVMQIFNSPAGPRQLSLDIGIPYSTVASIKNGASWNHLTGMPFKRKHKST